MTDANRHARPAVTPTVAFGVCTFRRPALERTLRSLAAQTLRQETPCFAIVADNDDVPSALPLVERMRTETSMCLDYVHAPARNISVARNALLDRARFLGADYLAMIDDDEVAVPEWAARLLDVMAGTGAEAVLGKVIAVYGKDAAMWMRRAGLHDTVPVIQPDGRILTGYAGNTILRLDSPHLRGRRFDLAFGRTGGEDDVFFRGLVKDGGTIRFAPTAIAYEDVPRDRERIGFLLRRNFRAGQTHALISARESGGRHGALFAKAAAKAAVLSAWAGLVSFWPARRTRALMRASLHVGVCSHVLGGRTLELYKS